MRYIGIDTCINLIQFKNDKTLKLPAFYEGYTYAPLTT